MKDQTRAQNNMEVTREASAARRQRQGFAVVQGRMPSLLGLGLGAALVLAVVGCHKTPAQDPAVAQTDQDSGDPADANMAPVSGNGNYSSGQPAQVLGQNVQYQPQQQGQDYGQQQAAPIERRTPNSGDPNAPQNYSNQGPPPDGSAYDNQQAEDAYASDLTDAEADQPPPPLPDYEPPPAPDPDYLWTPGYWAWGAGGYYWVPGCWVAAPYTGALWTPGYWGYVGNRYRFHHGFWGLHIGFYGGVDYGYGYTGYGYYGGYWDHDHFRYNTAVNRVNTTVIRNVYVHNVVINNRTVNGSSVNRVSYNGGRGGIQARPRAAEVAVLHEQRNAPMTSQVQVQREAAQNRAQFYSVNQGRPAVAVNARPVVADRTQPTALPRVAVPAGREGFTGNARPGQPGQPQSQARQVLPQGDLRQAQQENRPGQPQPNVRPGQPGSQQRAVEGNAAQPQVQPARPESQVRPGQLQQDGRQGQLRQPDVRTTQPNTTVRPVPQVQPVQPRPQFQQRSEVQQTQPRPQLQQRQEAQPAPQAQPRPQAPARPAEQPRPQQAAPAPHPAATPHPQPAAAPHPQPQSHAGPAPGPQGGQHGDDKPHH
jgi:hypothetical protein